MPTARRRTRSVGSTMATRRWSSRVRTRGCSRPLTPTPRAVPGPPPEPPSGCPGVGYVAGCPGAGCRVVGCPGAGSDPGAEKFEAAGLRPDQTVAEHVGLHAVLDPGA